MATSPTLPAVPAKVSDRVNQERVIATAAAIIDTEGIDALSLTRVAAALQVTQPALYKHVDGVQGLLRLLALAARRQLVDTLRRAAVGRTRCDAVRAVATAWRGFVRAHPGLYTATDRYPVGDDEEMKTAVADVVSVLEDVLQGFALTRPTRTAAAWSLRSAFHGFCVLEMEGGHPYPRDIDAGYRNLVDLLCAGLDKRERKS